MEETEGPATLPGALPCHDPPDPEPQAEGSLDGGFAQNTSPRRVDALGCSLAPPPGNGGTFLQKNVKIPATHLHQGPILP